MLRVPRLVLLRRDLPERARATRRPMRGAASAQGGDVTGVVLAVGFTLTAVLFYCLGYRDGLGIAKEDADMGNWSRGQADLGGLVIGLLGMVFLLFMVRGGCFSAEVF